MLKRILLSLPLWLAYTATALVLDVVGLMLIPLMLAGNRFVVRISDIWPIPTRVGGEVKGGLQVQWPRWAWLWSNEEDGVAGPTWYAARHPKWSGSKIAFFWSALRNPSNNMRFIPGINPVIVPKKIAYLEHHTETTSIVYTWQGIFSGLLITFPIRGRIFRFWWGWKLKPTDVAGVPDTDMRKPRCGFAIQFKRMS